MRFAFLEAITVASAFGFGKSNSIAEGKFVGYEV